MPQTDWRTDFRQKFTAFSNVYADLTELENFISDLLAQERERVIEQVKKLADPVAILKKSKKPKYGWSKGTNLYIEALDDVLELLENGKEAVVIKPKAE
jgi:hypothetical protein